MKIPGNKFKSFRFVVFAALTAPILIFGGVNNPAEASAIPQSAPAMRAIAQSSPEDLAEKACYYYRWRWHRRHRWHRWHYWHPYRYYYWRPYRHYYWRPWHRRYYYW